MRIRHLKKFNLTEKSTVDEILNEWDKVLGKYRIYEFVGQLSLLKNKSIINGSYTFTDYPIDMRIVLTTEVARDWYGSPSAFNSEYPDWNAICPSLIEKGDTVFDCGAHHGIYSIFFSKECGDEGRVIAFELVPINADLARMNADINGIKNIEVIAAGLSSKDQIIMSSPKDHSMRQSSSNDSVPMRLVKLDEYADEDPTVIKLDIEGSEVGALEGATELLKRNIKWIISVHPPFIEEFGHSPNEIFSFFPEERFDCFVLHPKYKGKYHKDIELDTFCELAFLPK